MKGGDRKGSWRGGLLVLRKITPSHRLSPTFLSVESVQVCVCKGRGTKERGGGGSLVAKCREAGRTIMGPR